MRGWFENWPLRRLLLVLMTSGAAVMLVIGLTGSLAARKTTQTVDALSRELSPAQVANAGFMEAMLDAETELRAYLISGEPSQLADHRAALARIPKAEADLEIFVRNHPAMAGLVAEQRPTRRRMGARLRERGGRRRARRWWTTTGRSSTSASAASTP